MPLGFNLSSGFSFATVIVQSTVFWIEFNESVFRSVEIGDISSVVSGYDARRVRRYILPSSPLLLSGSDYMIPVQCVFDKYVSLISFVVSRPFNFNISTCVLRPGLFSMGPFDSRIYVMSLENHFLIISHQGCVTILNSTSTSPCELHNLPIQAGCTLLSSNHLYFNVVVSLNDVRDVLALIKIQKSNGKLTSITKFEKVPVFNDIVPVSTNLCVGLSKAGTALLIAVEGNNCKVVNWHAFTSSHLLKSVCIVHWPNSRQLPPIVVGSLKHGRGAHFGPPSIGVTHMLHYKSNGMVPLNVFNCKDSNSIYLVTPERSVKIELNPKNLKEMEVIALLQEQLFVNDESFFITSKRIEINGERLPEIDSIRTASMHKDIAAIVVDNTIKVFQSNKLLFCEITLDFKPDIVFWIEMGWQRCLVVQSHLDRQTRIFGLQQGFYRALDDEEMGDLKNLFQVYTSCTRVTDNRVAYTAVGGLNGEFAVFVNTTKIFETQMGITEGIVTVRPCLWIRESNESIPLFIICCASGIFLASAHINNFIFVSFLSTGYYDWFDALPLKDCKLLLCREDGIYDALVHLDQGSILDLSSTQTIVDSPPDLISSMPHLDTVVTVSQNPGQKSVHLSMLRFRGAALTIEDSISVAVEGPVHDMFSVEADPTPQISGPSPVCFIGLVSSILNFNRIDLQTFMHDVSLRPLTQQSVLTIFQVYVDEDSHFRFAGVTPHMLPAAVTVTGVHGLGFVVTDSDALCIKLLIPKGLPAKVFCAGLVRLPATARVEYLFATPLLDDTGKGRYFYVLSVSRGFITLCRFREMVTHTGSVFVGKILAHDKWKHKKITSHYSLSSGKFLLALNNGKMLLVDASKEKHQIQLPSQGMDAVDVTPISHRRQTPPPFLDTPMETTLEVSKLTYKVVAKYTSPVIALRSIQMGKDKVLLCLFEDSSTEILAHRFKEINNHGLY
eukprot:TRINITY_DN1274_c0_g1_i1.p1 TRINITY_DN1274_c0_g1~~TRINITY_DN1274_c0_g1_i1.p1  ORF type:complete len:1072 (+),score=198.20 TRINITY_DN1274_c0_g1_i1:360-3218(+)